MLRRAMSESSRESELQAYRDGTDRRLLGWVVDGAVVSVLGLSRSQPRAEVLHIATDPARERQGFAAALVRAVLAEPASAELVAETDDDAVGFYRRSGFAVEEIASPWPTRRYRCIAG